MSDSCVKNLKDNIHVTTYGSTSSSFTCPFLFIKYVTKYLEYDVYQREKHISTLLDKFDWYPKLLYFDDKRKILIFRNVGKAVNRDNKPDDLEVQFDKILYDMESVNVQHNDIKLGEILMDENKKIYLCDFGWASVNKRLGCGAGLWDKPNHEKPYGAYDDKTTLQRLSLV